jgi:hypothetical protein
MPDSVMQIMGPTANTAGGLLGIVCDPDGCYRAPLRPDGKCISSDLPEKSGDVVVAVLDSGFILEHPVLAQFTEQSIDFTGEGVGTKMDTVPSWRSSFVQDVIFVPACGT